MQRLSKDRRNFIGICAEAGHGAVEAGQGNLTRFSQGFRRCLEAFGWHCPHSQSKHC